MSSNYIKYAATAAIAISSLAVIGYLYTSSKRKSASEESDSASDENIILQLPIIDLSLKIEGTNNRAKYEAECRKVADCLHRYGILVVRDPRVMNSDNERFLDLMERYFEGSDGVRDARPEVNFQVGVTPAYTEKPRDHCTRMGALGPNDQPLSPCPPEKDPKWRFFWRVGPRPEKSEFPSHNMDSVIPPEFPEWKEVMDMWGTKMIDAVTAAAAMAATGFNMPEDSFTKRMQCGPHLLAPTGSDFNRFGKVGTVLAGYHYDLNFLTIHGKSRFPGLYIWTRDGKKTRVQIPDGCLLVQAGKQIEYLTGGYVLAGFHEVVVNTETAAVINSRSAAGKSLWRVSSTLFSHINSDEVLQPLLPFDTPAAKKSFPPVKTGQQVLDELRNISLAQS